MKRIILVLAVIVSAFLLSPIGAMQASASVNSSACCANPSITVTSSGVVRVAPDFATVNLHIETKHRFIEEAQTKNAETMQKLVSALEKINISEGDITTNWFSIYPDYSYYNSRESLVGYRVSNQLCIKVRDVKNVGKVIDIATSAGANHVSGVGFGIEDNSQAHILAFERAIESAKQKAGAIAQKTGFGELRICSITEFSLPYMSFDRHCGVSAGTSLMHSEIEVTATVTVVFC